MTVHETHIILLEQALAEARAVEANVVALIEYMRALTPNKRDAEARNTAVLCAAVMRQVIASRVAAATALENLRYVRAVSEE